MLKGKTFIITGASRGIGRAIALEMAKQGANIALNYFETEEIAAELKQEIEKENVRCEIYYCDVSDFGKSKEMVDKAIKDFGKIDGLVNNAGIEKHNLIIRMSEEDFDKVIEVNLKGCFNMIKHLYSHLMRNRSGSIINIASVCGVRGWAAQANYAASKGGLISMTKSVAKELGARGITCNAVAPGFIETKMTEVLREEEKKSFTDFIPLKRAGTVDDVAKLCSFLASDAASYITGEVIKVDGGLCI